MNDEKISIRDGSVADIDAVQSIYKREVLEAIATFEKIPPTLDEMLNRRAAILQHGLPYLVAEIGGKVVGYSYASEYRARSAYNKTVEDAIYINPDYHGRGIGRLLLETLITKCEAADFYQMIAIIGDSDNRGSIALHKKLGFRNVGTLKSVGFKFGRWVDSVIMQRQLGKGGSAD